MPALVQKPARAQMNDSRCRSAGLRPNSVTVIVDSRNRPMVSDLTLKRCVRIPNTAPPVAPPTFIQTSTPAAVEGAKPRSTTIFGIHFAMK